MELRPNILPKSTDCAAQINKNLQQGINLDYVFIEIKHRADKMLGQLPVKLRKEIFWGHLKICKMAYPLTY